MKRLSLLGLICGAILLGNINLNQDRLLPGLRSGDLYKTWVYFTDKGQSVDSAQEEAKLTARSVQRRQKTLHHRFIGYRDRPVSADYLRAVRLTGARIQVKSRWFNAVSVLASWDQLGLISRLECVERIEPVMQAKRKPPDQFEIVPDMSQTRRFTGLDYGAAWVQIEQINAQVAHDNGYAGQGVLILMLDTGFNRVHSVFDSLKVVAERDFINNDSNTGADSTDSLVAEYYHGTECLSIIGGYAPGEYIGPAYKASYLLAKTEKTYSESPIEEDLFVAGLEWGDSLGMDIASSSLGYNDWYEYSDMDGNTAMVTRAIDYAVSVGVVCVTSAGNEANVAWRYIIAPADADSVISVGAVNSNGFIASFSSRGPTFDGRLKPEVCALGLGTAMANPGGAGYFNSNGTSFSAPLVSGAAAIILSAHPDWTPMMVREALMMTASQADAPDTIYGYGIINTWGALNYLGFGPANGDLPESIALGPAFPNPFNLVTRMMIATRHYGEVKLDIFNLYGQFIETAFQGDAYPGKRFVTWQPGNQPSGVYFARLKQGDQTATRKLILIK